MKAHIITLVVVDLDEVGAEEIKDILENIKYPNHCMSPTAEKIETFEIGEWRDDHPLNLQTTDALRWLAENGEIDQ